MSDLVCQLFKSLLHTDREHLKHHQVQSFILGFANVFQAKVCFAQFIGYSIYFLSIKCSPNSESQYIFGSIIKQRISTISKKEEHNVSYHQKERTSITSAINMLREKI